ncbi:hypothetical protein [Rhodoplanes serenus]|nr:hypothetical protein [Rhodoplanes serenus]
MNKIRAGGKPQRYFEHPATIGDQDGQVPPISAAVSTMAASAPLLDVPL